MKHRARKRFGQHFLVDPGVIGAIVAAMDLRPGQAVVEIGPGLGALTQPLLAHRVQLTAIELDRDLAAGLRRHPQLQLLQADALTVDFSALAQRLQAPALRICGNLPYNISSPLLFHLLEHIDCIQDQHFMLQREVVQRMVAAPHTRTYGRLSVMLQWRYHMEQLLDVPPQAFRPAPRVHSAVVRMIPRRDVPAVDAGLLSELVRVAFSQRRKLLRHSLGRWLQARGSTVAFDLQRRAEEVPVAEYLELAQALAADHSGAIGPNLAG